MPLSPHEERVLATLEEGLRADDPVLAAALGETPSASRSASVLRAVPLSTLHVVALIVALLVLIGSAVVVGDRPAVLAVLTSALLLPWLVYTARSTARGSAAADRPPGARRRRGTRLLGIGIGPLALGVVLLLVVLAVVPPAGQATVGLLVVFVVAPLLALRVMGWTDRGTPR